MTTPATPENVIQRCRALATDLRYPVTLRALMGDISDLLQSQEKRIAELQAERAQEVTPQAAIDESLPLPPRQVFSNNMGFFVRTVPTRPPPP